MSSAPTRITSYNVCYTKLLRTFLGEVVAVDPREGWRDIRPFTEGFSWRLADGRLLFPDIDGFSYTEPGSTLAFEAGTKKVCDGALDLESRPRWVEKRAGGILRFHEPLAQYPPVGSRITSYNVCYTKLLRHLYFRLQVTQP